MASPRAFAEGTLAAALQQWKTLDGSVTSTTIPEHDSPQPKTKRESTVHLYLVVDIAASDDTYTTDDVDEDARQRQFQVKVDTAERLARHVAQSRDFRSMVDGITVGIANNVRAAPGLEACVDAVLHGASHRRRRGASGAKSNIGLVALHPDDLLGLQDETVTDAAQGVLQSRTCAEWNGNGDLLSFARRAHSGWCIANGVGEESTAGSPSGEPKSRKRRRRRRRGDMEGDLKFDPFMTCLIVFFFGYVLSHLWITYYAER